MHKVTTWLIVTLMAFILNGCSSLPFSKQTRELTLNINSACDSNPDVYQRPSPVDVHILVLDTFPDDEQLMGQAPYQYFENLTASQTAATDENRRILILRKQILPCQAISVAHTPLPDSSRYLVALVDFQLWKANSWRTISPLSDRKKQTVSINIQDTTVSTITARR